MLPSGFNRFSENPLELPNQNGFVRFFVLSYRPLSSTGGGGASMCLSSVMCTG